MQQTYSNKLKQIKELAAPQPPAAAIIMVKAWGTVKAMSEELVDSFS